MPRAKVVKPPVYQEQELVYCYHGSMLFKAVILEIFEGEGEDDELEYGIHYFGWKDKYDERVMAECLCKMNEENDLLYEKLKAENEHAKGDGKGKAKGNDKKKSKTVSRSTSMTPAASMGGKLNTPATSTRSKAEEKQKAETATQTNMVTRADSIVGKPNTRATSTRAKAEETKEAEAASHNVVIVTPTAMRIGKLNLNSPPSAGDPNDANSPRARKRRRETEIEEEEEYLRREDVKIEVPEVLRALLVADWENVTKKLLLVPLPKNPTVNGILEFYKDQSQKNGAGGSHPETVEEILAGLKLYFEQSLGTILLYAGERQQYEDIKKENPDKDLSDIYGAEHLLRLCVTMPELLAHTNLDAEGMAKVCDLIEDLLRFIAEDPNRWVAESYESARPRYFDPTSVSPDGGPSKEKTFSN